MDHVWINTDSTLIYTYLFQHLYREQKTAQFKPVQENPNNFQFSVYLTNRKEIPTKWNKIHKTKINQNKSKIHKTNTCWLKLLQYKKIIQVWLKLTKNTSKWYYETNTGWTHQLVRRLIQNKEIWIRTKNCLFLSPTI